MAPMQGGYVQGGSITMPPMQGGSLTMPGGSITTLSPPQGGSLQMQGGSITMQGAPPVSGFGFAPDAYAGYGTPLPPPTQQWSSAPPPMTRIDGFEAATGPAWQSARPQFSPPASARFVRSIENWSPGPDSSQFQFAPNYDNQYTPNYAVPSAPKLEQDFQFAPRSSPAPLSGKSFEQWPETVTAEDFQVQALERESLRTQERHLARRLQILEKLICPRTIDEPDVPGYDNYRKFEKLCYPEAVRDPNYVNDYHTFYVQKDKVLGREHQLAEFYRRLEHHPIIYTLGGVKEIAEKDFVEAATDYQFGGF